MHGEAIADAQVDFELRQQMLNADATLGTRLAPVSDASKSLSKTKTDVRPQIVKELRSALGADSL
jgi:uncharacterized protein involved in exopolysaccharide biosynthesis